MPTRQHSIKTFLIITAALIAAVLLAYVAYAHLDIPRADNASAVVEGSGMPFPVAPPIDGGQTFSMHIDELTEPVASVYYECAENKNFIARVEIRPQAMGNAEVFLNDGSKLLLSQTASASGARYANSGESFVFWNKGNTAFIEEDGQMLYADCVAQDTE